MSDIQEENSIAWGPFSKLTADDGVTNEFLMSEFIEIETKYLASITCCTYLEFPYLCRV
jgi:hypothetical protein